MGLHLLIVGEIIGHDHGEVMVMDVPTLSPYKVCTPIMNTVQNVTYFQIKKHHKNLNIDYTRCTESKHETLKNLVLVFYTPKDNTLKIHNLFIQGPNNVY